MIKHLQSKKGFSLVELIAVIAIVAVLTAVILPMMSNKRAKITEANSTAKDFYSAMQFVFTKYSLYEGYFSNEFDPNISTNSGYGTLPEDPTNPANRGIMKYYLDLNGNYPFDAKWAATKLAASDSTAYTSPLSTSVYIELYAKNNSIEFINARAIAHDNPDYSNAWYYLRKQRTDDLAKLPYQEFAKSLAAELQGRISYMDGYYLAKVSYTEVEDSTTIPSTTAVSPIRVDYTAYMKKSLPEAGPDPAVFMTDNLYFIKDNTLANDEICGVCSKFYSKNDKFIANDPFIKLHPTILETNVGWEKTYLF